MAWWQVLEGKHTHDNGKVYVKGDKFEDERDMAAKFKNKFAKLDNVVVVHAPPTEPAPVAVKEEEDVPLAAPSDSKQQDDPRGKDVTDKYPLAVEKDLKVFKDDGVYDVYDHAEKVSKDEMTKKSEVTAFLEQYAAE